MTIKHYDVVRASSPSSLAEKLTQKIKEGWQPFGSPVAITPYTLMQAVSADGDVTTPVVVNPVDGVATVISTTSEPEWYYVVVIAGQSNAMSYGEGIPLPESYDRPDPRIKQLARRSTVTPGGEKCAFNDIIPADHCLHDVQDMSKLNHPKADLSKGQYGCVGQGLHIAKKLLPYIPANAGILLVPCARGGSAFTIGKEGAFSESSGATETSERWGVGKPLYQDLIFRTKAALQKNPKNILLAVVWMQGEFDFDGTPSEHGSLFKSMVDKYRTDLSDVAGQCVGGGVAGVPWICGDTTYFWKQKSQSSYETVYGSYKNKTDQNIHFVSFMTDENGANVQTNKPEEDPDIPGIGYYGSTWRNSSATWTSSLRNSHFSSWARRGIISDRLATAIIEHAGKTEAFVHGIVTSSKEEELTNEEAEPVAKPTTRTALSLTGSGGDVTTAQGWTIKNCTVKNENNALVITKSADKAWELYKGAEGVAPELLKNGGKLTCKFRLSDALKNDLYSLGFYFKTDEQLPEGLSIGGNGNVYLANYVIQRQSDKMNLLMHRKSGGNVPLGSFGNFDGNLHTLELLYEAGNGIVTPVFDGNPGNKFSLVRDQIPLGWRGLVLTDITNSDTGEVVVESLTLEVNEAASA